MHILVYVLDYCVELLVVLLVVLPVVLPVVLVPLVKLFLRISCYHCRYLLAEVFQKLVIGMSNPNQTKKNNNNNDKERNKEKWISSARG